VEFSNSAFEAPSLAECHQGWSNFMNIHPKHYGANPSRRIKDSERAFSRSSYTSPQVAFPSAWATVSSD
jgi:hypothetical protein